MFNVESIVSFPKCDECEDVIKFIARLNDIETDLFYNIVREDENGNSIPFQRESLKFELTFVFNKKTYDLDLLKIFANDGSFTIDKPLTFNNFDGNNIILIKNRLIELIDFNESAKEAPLIKVMSDVLLQIVKEKKGIDIVSSKTEAYENVALSIKSKLTMALPFHQIHCYAIYSGKKRTYGKSWQVLIYSKIKDGYIKSFAIPVDILLTVTKQYVTASRNYYGLKDILLLDSESLNISLSEYEYKYYQERTNRLKQELLDKEKSREQKIAKAKSDMKLYKKRLIELDSEDVLKSSLYSILDSSNDLISEEQEKLFTECKTIMTYMENYITLSKKLLNENI